MTSQHRLQSIDVTRGLIMVFMAVDHAAIFIGGSRYISPLKWSSHEAPEFTSVWSFLTCYLPNICATGFSFLMGLGMVLYHARREQVGGSVGRSVAYFAKRALLLIFLQFAVENPAWCLGGVDSFALPVNVGILAALGGIMLLASPLLSLAVPTLLAVALGLEGAYVFAMGHGHVFGTTTQIPSVLKFLVYPSRDAYIDVWFTIVPWICFAIAGMAAGKLLLKDRRAFFRWLPVAGVVLLAAFVPVRLFGGVSFNLVDLPARDLMSLFVATKYPPSISYQLCTFGIILLVFWAAEALAVYAFVHRAFTPLRVLGSSALFFYVVHLYVYALMGRPFEPAGLGLGAVYAGLLAGLVMLLPLCGRFTRFKRAQHPDSLWRML